MAFVAYWCMHDVRTFEAFHVAKILITYLVSSYRKIPHGGGKGICCRAVETRFDGFSYSLGSEICLASPWRLEMLDPGGHFYGVC
jgi:hypothetical protein